VSMTVNKNAPVIADSEIVIAARPDDVWETLTHFESWPTWIPDVKSMSIEGEPLPGTHFRWKAGPATIKSRIQEVERPHVIAWTGKTFGISAAHVYQLSEHDGETAVRSAESYDGVLARFFRRRMQKMLKGSLEAGLQHLKEETERRSREARKSGGGGIRTLDPPNDG
jgi:uncharacterized protein YndB with AHSA1/START domain